MIGTRAAAVALSVLLVLPLGHAQAQTNAEIMKKLEQLEQENAALKQKLEGASAEDLRKGGPSDQLPAQVTPGWWVHLHQYNDPDAKTEPMQTFRYDQQQFAATIGYNTPNSLKWIKIRTFRFEGWLRVAKAGTVQLGANVATGWNHPFNLTIRVSGTTVLQKKNYANDGTDNEMIYTARHFEPGDYRIEYIWGISKTSFIKYQPDQTKIEPLIRTADDMNFRRFNADELLVPDRNDVPIGPEFYLR